MTAFLLDVFDRPVLALLPAHFPPTRPSGRWSFGGKESTSHFNRRQKGTVGPWINIGQSRNPPQL